MTESPAQQPARPGEAQAYRELVQRHARSLYQRTYRMVGNREDAEDIVQEALFRGYREMGGYRDEAHLTSALFRIASNLSIDALRRRGRWKHNALEDHETVSPLTSAEAGPHRQFTSREIRRRVAEAMDDLTPKERVAFTLRHYEGLPMKEISAITGVNVNSTKNHVFRAVQKLRRALQPIQEAPR